MATHHAPPTLSYGLHTIMGNGLMHACHHAGKGAVKKKTAKAAGGPATATAAISAVASELLASAKLTRKAEKPATATAEKGSSKKRKGA